MDNEQPSRQPKSLQHVLDRLGIEASMGHHHAVIGAGLEESLTTAAWETAPEFFGYTLTAHFVSALLGLTRLLDRRNDTVNLDVLAEFVEREAGGFVEVTSAEVRASLLPRIHKEIRERRADLEPLKRRRNQQYGHASLHRTLTDAEWGVAWSDMERAYERVIAVVNFVAKAFQAEKAMIMIAAV